MGTASVETPTGECKSKHALSRTTSRWLALLYASLFMLCLLDAATYKFKLCFMSPNADLCLPRRINPMHSSP